MVEKWSDCYTHPGEKLPCAKCEADLAAFQKREEERRKLEEERTQRTEQKRLQDLKDHPEPMLTVFGVGKRFLSCSFKTFKGAEKVKDVCKSIVETPESVVLTGDIGSGKTHLAVAMLRELVECGKVVNKGMYGLHMGAIFITVPDLLLIIRSGFNDGSRQTEEDFVDQYAKAPFLVLDDLGAEKSTEWAVATLSAIIDRRYRELLPTIYTTNLTLDEIGSQLSRRIASRMADAKIIKLSMPDYRRKR